MTLSIETVINLILESENKLRTLNRFQHLTVSLTFILILTLIPFLSVLVPISYTYYFAIGFLQSLHFGSKRGRDFPFNIISAKQNKQLC